MSWTKRQVIVAAFAELGLGSQAYDLQPDDLQHGLRRLDAMAAEWNGRGIRIGYPLTSTPSTSTLDTDTGAPDAAIETLILNLAVRIAPAYGKQPMPDTKATAVRGYNTLMALASQPMEMQFPGTMPAGAGWKPGRTIEEFLSPTPQPLLAGGDGPIEFD